MTTTTPLTSGRPAETTTRGPGIRPAEPDEPAPVARDARLTTLLIAASAWLAPGIATVGWAFGAPVNAALLRARSAALTPGSGRRP